ncbi:PPR domain protein, partial [Rhizoctonia solani 123E]
VLKVLPESVSEEPRIWATALEVLLEAGDEQLRKEVAEKLEVIVKTQNVLDTHVWAPLVLYVGRVESPQDKNAAYEVLRAFDTAGGLPDTVLLTALLGALPLSERTPNTLRRLENETGVPADERIWSVLVDAALERIGVAVGPEPEDTSIMGIWSSAAESGVNLTSTVLDRVLAREDVSIVDRLRAYKVVHASWPAEKQKERSDDEEETDIDKWMRREDALTTPGPTAKTYSTLLRALVAQKGNELDKTTASAVAVEILTDMRQRGIKFSHIAQAPNPPAWAGKAGGSTITPTPLSPLASLTILLMRNAPSHEAAFKAYAYACVIDPSSHSFGEREYRAILKNFAGLKVQRDKDQLLREGSSDQWGDGASIEAILGPRTEVYAPPPAALYYEIMRDMQRAGYSAQQTEYSAILRAYANTCLVPPEESESAANKMLPAQARSVAASATLARAHNAHVLEHIQRIHTLLKLDTDLTPDTGLLNSLMLAYGHAGAIENVLAIWGQMVDRRWNSASASIVIDALGRSGRSNLNRARKLWDLLRRHHGSKLTVNIYTSWVEALCRLGEFAEAERVVFVDMSGNVRPDEKTLRTLVSFAWRVGRQAKVLDDVRRQFPGVI